MSETRADIPMNVCNNFCIRSMYAHNVHWIHVSRVCVMQKWRSKRQKRSVCCVNTTARLSPPCVSLSILSEESFCMPACPLPFIDHCYTLNCYTLKNIRFIRYINSWEYFIYTKPLWRDCLEGLNEMIAMFGKLRTKNFRIASTILKSNMLSTRLVTRANNERGKNASGETHSLAMEMFFSIGEFPSTSSHRRPLFLITFSLLLQILFLLFFFPDLVLNKWLIEVRGL